MSPVKYIIHALTVGVETDLNASQSERYEHFIESMKGALANSPETTRLALEQCLARPKSQARMAVLEEELDLLLGEINFSTTINYLTEQANRFIETVQPNQNDIVQNVSQKGQYNINISRAGGGLVIGDSNNITQSFD